MSLHGIHAGVALDKDIEVRVLGLVQGIEQATLFILVHRLGEFPGRSFEFRLMAILYIDLGDN